MPITEAEARATGFNLPPGDQDLALGDEAIRENAVKALEYGWKRWALPSRTDLNSVTEQGGYDIPATVLASIPNKPSGLPTTGAARLDVLAVSTVAVIQDFHHVPVTATARAYTYRRHLTLDGATWSPWYELAPPPSKPVITDLMALFPNIGLNWRSKMVAQGNVIQMTLSGTAPASGISAGNIGKLPAGTWPAVHSYGYGANTGDGVLVTPAGDVMLPRIPANAYYNTTMTWVN